MGAYLRFLLCSYILRSVLYAPVDVFAPPFVFGVIGVAVFFIAPLLLNLSELTRVRGPEVVVFVPVLLFVFVTVAPTVLFLGVAVLLPIALFSFFGFIVTALAAAFATALRLLIMAIFTTSFLTHLHLLPPRRSARPARPPAGRTAVRLASAFASVRPPSAVPVRPGLPSGIALPAAG